MDSDDSPIGGLQKPMQPTKQLFTTSIVMDVFALLCSLYISLPFAVGILLYILVSRAYSYRGIRLKQFPVIGFLTVFLFQGAAVFWLSFHGAHPNKITNIPVLPCAIASCLIGALYPLTQIYQHKQDKEDGVTTISFLLGKRGTFLFSMFLFMAAALLLFIWFRKTSELNFFYLFLLLTLPVVCFFLYWMRKVYQNELAANFKNSLLMNVTATFFTALYFSTLIILKH